MGCSCGPSPARWGCRSRRSWRSGCRSCTAKGWRAGSARSARCRARELLERLTSIGVPWAIATSGRAETAHRIAGLLEVPPDTVVITRDEVPYAKPNPDLFLAAAARLGRDPHDCFVVGDSVWDMLAARRASALGIGLLSGGYGREELTAAGTYRVYDDPADLLAHLDELGIRH